MPEHNASDWREQMKHEIKNPTLSERVITLIENARRKVASVANVALVYTYYEIGRMIVEDEQGGNRRAGYGEKTLEDLSSKLTARFGRGWSKENLKLMRRFFVEYSNSVNTVYPIASGTKTEGDKEAADSANANSVNTVYEIGAGSKNEAGNDAADKIVHTVDDFRLSWSHYLVLMRIADPSERLFYEREAAAGQWSLRQMSRQIGSQLYERSLKQKGKADVRELMRKAPRPEVAEEPLKDPYMLEFLGLPESTDYSESQLEQAIIDHLQEFMLELGKGFTFVGRQVRFTFEEEHYKVDLVFYNRLTRSFFLFDLKLSKITHQDLGQMQMYVHYYDRVVKLPDENPTIGVLLSSEEVNDATVKLTLPECEHNRIFARQYKTVLPTIATFKRIIRQQRIVFENRLLSAEKKDARNE